MNESTTPPDQAGPEPATSTATAPYGRTAAQRAMVARLHQLAAALTARGLTVRVGDGTLLARNEAASGTGDPRGRALDPGLSQTVAVTARDDGTLHFHWCWAGATRGAPLELEYMTPADDIDGAARRIARVLALAGE